MIRSANLVASVVLTGIVAMPAIANAQSVEPVRPGTAVPATDTDAATVQDIIVTAQRRSENVQRVPIAISVVSGEGLGRSNINNAESLPLVVPSLTFKRGTTNSNSTLAIRGIGTQSFSPGAEPSVSTVVDGVVYARSGMAFQEFADIDRIEVLRGPQGTLFGKNASAGALNIVTLAPSEKLTADASLSYFEGNEFRATGNISLPITDQAKLRISAVYGKYDGNIQNVFNGRKVNGYERYGIRAKLVDEIGDLKITLSGDYTRANDNCCADVLGTIIPNAQIANVFLPAQLPVIPGPRNRQINQNFQPRTTDTNAGISLTADLALGDYTLTSITAYRKWRNQQFRDGDFGSVSGTYVASMNIDQRDDGRLNFNQYSQELRIASPTGNLVDYVAGVFLWRTDEEDRFTRSTSLCSASTLPADATGFQPCRAGLSTFVTSSAPGAYDTNLRSTAAFGQATVNVSDALKLVGGLRYTRDHVYYDYTRTLIGPVAPGLQASFVAAESARSKGWSGRAGAQWQASPDVMAYANYSRGYKGAALNVFYSMNANSLGRIAPEQSNAYEVGIKSKLLDRRLTLNATGFWEDLSNFQANTFTTTGNGTVLVSLTNAGKVRSRGIELDLTWQAAQGLRFTGGYSFTDAKIVSFFCAPTLTGANLATCLAHNGKPLTFAPRNKLNISGNWTLPIGDALPFDVQLGSLFAYTSRTNFDIDQTPLAFHKRYATIDANVSFTSKDGKYELSLIGKNLTDQFYTSFVTPSGNGVSAGSYARLQIPRDAQRYFGIRASVRY